MNEQHFIVLMNGRDMSASRDHKVFSTFLIISKRQVTDCVQVTSSCSIMMYI